jgi:hypothetical protein
MLYEMVLPKKDNGDCFKELLDMAILISPHTDLNGKSLNYYLSKSHLKSTSMRIPQRK